jgi:UPF0176 protein
VYGSPDPATVSPAFPSSQLQTKQQRIKASQGSDYNENRPRLAPRLPESMSVVIAAFYKFVHLRDFQELRQPLLDNCEQFGIKGTILLAAEGINGTIAGSRSSIDAVLAALRSDPRLRDLVWKESLAVLPPFDRLKIKIKPEIVTIGMPEIDPMQQVGTYVSPEEWNALIADPEVTLIDTRNEFEVAIGSFEGAQNPHTKSFRDFPKFVQQTLDPTVHRKVALFCTGGIRCEKASSYLLAQGFSEVYHLKGGILKYLETVPTAESQWHGECFVFDQRVSVQHGLALGTYQLCPECGYPISSASAAAEDITRNTCRQCCAQIVVNTGDRALRSPELEG